ncbi:hypothetical protein GIB67_019798 [Kingdonia uniflora]|uniref:Choline transporter-like protein n=1 Tax=Kingdonia uniflora TaxID=39325 RepID=A0A7J7MKC7_9MAGN|nr:hypothetical protein GIB67_019798 [Kingdonia uniflora]
MEKRGLEKDLEEGGVDTNKNEEEKGEKEKEFEKDGVMVTEKHSQREFKVSKIQTLNLTNPLRINVIEGATHYQASTRAGLTPPSSQLSLNRATPQQSSMMSLNSRAYTNRISLFVFILHLVAVIGLVCYCGYKAVKEFVNTGSALQRKEKRILSLWFPQVECSLVLSIGLAFAWQKAVRVWPGFMIQFILWSTFATSMAAGILLVCIQKPSTTGVGVVLIGFAIGNGLYACWVSRRVPFTAIVLKKSLEPVLQFHDLNQPTYWMLGLGFMWISIWVLAVIGALNFYFPPLVIVALVFSLAWTAEVLRNVANLTVSRVISLYYLRGMQSSTQFCFQRAMSRNLGSACLGSFFVPAIEALRIIARGLNLLEGEDEFMFSCAHCCLRVMESIFRYGNGWAFVQIATYGKGFVRASQDTWGMFERQGMEPIVDSDIISSLCFLTGVCSGSICVLAMGSWTYAVHRSFTATVSLMAFFIGYLLTRIAMALPHACVSCYYVCYAENPKNILFNEIIPDRINLLKSGRDVIAPTPRVPVPRRFNT